MTGLNSAEVNGQEADLSVGKPVPPWRAERIRASGPHGVTQSIRAEFAPKLIAGKVGRGLRQTACVDPASVGRPSMAKDAVVQIELPARFLLARRQTDAGKEWKRSAV